jgi:hypothetical protein
MPLLPNDVLAEMVSNLEPIKLFKGEEVIAFIPMTSKRVDFDTYEIIEYNEDCLTVQHTWDIFSKMTQLFGGF